MKKNRIQTNRFLLAAMALAASSLGLSAASAPLWLRDVKISPDGSTIAFTYKGDIYTVPSEGGTASRLTTSGSYESSPVWSPDGKQIAFASDHHGSADVFVMPATGGQVKRLTSFSGSETPEAFSADGRFVYFSAVIQDPAESASFPSSRLPELYQVPVGGGAVKRVLATPAQRLSVAPDGSFLLYQDDKGTENEWRKHHTSSVTRGLWKYDFKTGEHTPLVDHAGEDRDPVVSPDGKTMLFLSERDGGSMNVYSLALDNVDAAPKALTSFKEHPVRFLSQGRNGLTAMTWDGEIYTMMPGRKPARLNVEIVADDYYAPSIMNVSSGAQDAVPSPDGKMVAFIRRGDLFVTSVEYPTTKQVTATPQAESAPTWGSDNRTIYYVSDRSGRPDLYVASLTRDDDPDFPNATAISDSSVFKSGNVERDSPQVSPDGKKLAYVEDRCRLMVMDIDSRKVTQLTDGSLAKARMGVDFTWSPDSRWIAFTTVGHGHDPYMDLAIVNVDGKNPEITPLTESAYFDESPRWSPDGSCVVFVSDRFGMRNQASWGSQSDVFAVFVNQDALDRFQMNEEDYKLLVDAESKSKKEKKDSADDEADDLVKVEREGMADRLVRLTPFSSDLAGAVMDKKSEKLYFLTRVEKGYDLWQLDLRKGGASIAQKLGAGAPPSMAFDADASALFLLSGSMMKKITLPGSAKNITYNARMRLDRAAEREYML
ncbi:MAG: peptidase S41, partial [Muribaculaceae bacterium]|nr:peptidase S41 [Muribaculaceae bacterium]